MPTHTLSERRKRGLPKKRSPAETAKKPGFGAVADAQFDLLFAEKSGASKKVLSAAQSKLLRAIHIAKGKKFKKNQRF